MTTWPLSQGSGSTQRFPRAGRSEWECASFAPTQQEASVGNTLRSGPWGHKGIYFRCLCISGKYWSGVLHHRTGKSNFHFDTSGHSMRPFPQMPSLPSLFHQVPAYRVLVGRLGIHWLHALENCRFLSQPPELMVQRWFSHVEGWVEGDVSKLFISLTSIWRQGVKSTFISLGQSF